MIVAYAYRTTNRSFKKELSDIGEFVFAFFDHAPIQQIDNGIQLSALRFH
ncbi:MAG TPA: hypothetical protein PKM99_07180 [Thermotogota bacterium]|nr:hypothetical protein [Thermotogota bacterium]HNR63623.1 hypothetical protein [Thermotogota bacterium]HNT95881.1 hypothetical protein [Thermotogota bacterium]HPM20908.1 hypothetical protein [Thermotogota bacterium]